MGSDRATPARAPPAGLGTDPRGCPSRPDGHPRLRGPASGSIPEERVVWRPGSPS